MSQGKKDNYNHKFTLIPKYGNWTSPHYLRSTVVYTKKKPIIQQTTTGTKSGKIVGGRYYKYRFNKTKKNKYKVPKL